MQNRKEKLNLLIEKYHSFKEQGRLDLSSEQTIREWIKEFLEIFDWDVMDTSQILQEKVLTKDEKKRLVEIGSTSTRPDYTFKRGKEKFTFLDAKGTFVNLKTDSKAAFQIKSYGWSILAPCAFITNFEEFAIYDCTYIPMQNQNANFGRIYLTIDNYIEKFDILESHLLKSNILKGNLFDLYSDTLKNEKSIQKLSPDFLFAEQLSNFRLILANSILENNKTLINDNSELLAYITQVIINRIIFIRICESRLVEKEGLLLKFKEKSFWEKFKESSYNDFYKHYDGPLFERINIIHKINIPDEIFNGLLELFYYPSPYRFDVIPTKLLSDIYEIFLSKKLYIEKDTVFEKLKPEYMKTNGAISTPQFLVQDLLKRTIPKNELLSNDFQEFFKIKILDFACGSGIFLIEIFDYLQNLMIEHFSLNPIDNYAYLFFTNGNNTTLTIEGKRKLISNCIYAVDIDPEAVEVARMSLSLKVIDNIDFHESYQEIGIYGNNILNNIGNNIKCGNTLVSYNITEEYPEINEDNLQLNRTNPFDWDSTSGFSEIFKINEGFDYIVGNPPYVEVKNYNLEYPFMHQYIRKKYETTKNGKVDLSVAFIERGIELLNKKGKLGLIIQKRFFKTEYGKKIREYISSNKLLYQVIDFDSTNLFKDRITYIAFLILKKSQTDLISFLKITNQVKEIPAKLENIELFEKDNTNFTQLPSNAFNSNPWNFDDSELLRIKTKLLNKYGKFGDFAEVKGGIQVLWNKAYHLKVKVFNNDGTILCDSNIENDFKIELDACKPLLVNESFYPFCRDITNTYVIFPYDVNEFENIPIGFSEFSQRFPLAGLYLERHKKEILENVETIKDKELWHQFTRVQNHTSIYPKVLLPMTAMDTFATITNNSDNYCDNANMFFINIPQKDDNHLYCVASIINSTIFSVFARSIANPQQNGYFKFNKQFIEPIPFPKLIYENNPNLITDIANIGRNIDLTQNQFISSTPHQKNILRNRLITFWRDLDEKVYELYQLNEEEINYFNQKGRNINRIEVIEQL